MARFPQESIQEQSRVKMCQCNRQPTKIIFKKIFSLGLEPHELTNIIGNTLCHPLLYCERPTLRTLPTGMFLLSSTKMTSCSSQSSSSTLSISSCTPFNRIKGLANVWAMGYRIIFMILVQKEGSESAKKKCYDNPLTIFSSILKGRKIKRQYVTIFQNELFP